MTRKSATERQIKKCWLSYLLPEDADVDDDDADEDSGETFLHGGVAVDHGDNVQKKRKSQIFKSEHTTTCLESQRLPTTSFFHSNLFQSPAGQNDNETKNDQNFQSFFDSR